MQTVRAVTVAERNVQQFPPRVVVVPAGVATLIFSDTTHLNNTAEIQARILQNVGANPMYYTEGVLGAAGAPSCDNINNFHGLILAGQQFDCGGHRLTVCVFSVLGTTVSTTLRQRILQSNRN